MAGVLHATLVRGIDIGKLKDRLLDGSFTEATLARPDIRAAMEKVRFEAYEAPGEGYTNVTTLLEVACRDGRRIEERVDWAMGAAQAPMGFEDVARKFRECATYAEWPAGRTEALVESVASLEALDDAGRLARLAGLGEA